MTIAEKKSLTNANVREVLSESVADRVTLRNDVWTVRRGFFYTGGVTALQYMNRIHATVTDAIDCEFELVDYGEV